MPKCSAPWGAVLVLLAVSAAGSSAQPAPFYSEISGAVWVVKDLAKPLAGWRSLGLEQVRDHGQVVCDAPKSGRGHFVSGRLGRFDLEFLQPVAGDPVFDGFLQHHHDGIFAVVHAVPDQRALDSEIARLGQLGAGVLKTMQVDGARYTFFDTDAQGKYVLGLVLRPLTQAALPPVQVTHLGFVIRDPAPVSAYWRSLGFPEMRLADAGPRPDSRYKGKPLSLNFMVGSYSYSHPTFEWIIAPSDPPNCYADFLRDHGEGVQHIGVPVDDLDKAEQRYTQLGYPPLQQSAWGDLNTPNSGHYAYMNTGSLGGVSVELYHANH